MGLSFWSTESSGNRERAAQTQPSLVVAQSGIDPNSRHVAAEIQLNVAR